MHTESLSKVRRAAVAGLFYPGSADALRRQVAELLDQAPAIKPAGPVHAIIVPHAGLMYSGATAAHAYRAVAGMDLDAVVVVGPSHREYFEGISVSPAEEYETPLGPVAIQRDIRGALVKAGKGIVIDDAGHRTEHSIEVQLPFLQRVLEHVPFVPVVMGDQNPVLTGHLAEALAAVAAHRNLLLIASSDLSHYYPYRDAMMLDARVLEDIEAFAPERLQKKLTANEVEACGGGPMVAVMAAAKHLGAGASQVLQYCNSGDVTGEKEAVVGYCSALLTGKSS